MLQPARKFNPAVVIDPTLAHIDDRAAGKFVDAMLRQFNIIGQAAWKHTNDNARGPAGGNAVSQRRVFRRCCERYGPSLMHADIWTGKRQHRVRFDSWIATDAMGSDRNRFSQLRGSIRYIDIDLDEWDPKKRFDDQELDVIAISHHALCRMIQRAGCRTEADAIAILKAVWPAICGTSYAMGRDPNGAFEFWLPVAGFDLAMCVKTGETSVAIIPTVVPRSELARKERGAAIAELEQFVAATGRVALLDGKFDKDTMMRLIRPQK